MHLLKAVYLAGWEDVMKTREVALDAGQGGRGTFQSSFLVTVEPPLLVAKTLSFPLKGGNARVKSDKKRVKRKAAAKGNCKYLNGIHRSHCRYLSDFKIGFQEFAQ